MLPPVASPVTVTEPARDRYRAEPGTPSGNCFLDLRETTLPLHQDSRTPRTLARSQAERQLIARVRRTVRHQGEDGTQIFRLGIACTMTEELSRGLDGAYLLRHCRRDPMIERHAIASALASRAAAALMEAGSLRG